jgi:magnesium transporter
VLCILTVFSIVFRPATLIASIWGMNVGLPGGGEPPSADTTLFWIIVGSMVALLAGLLVFFRRRGWL